MCVLCIPVGLQEAGYTFLHSPGISPGWNYM